MHYLAHRGNTSKRTVGKAENSRNTLTFAAKHGYGLETDLRDLDGEIVISHDMPRAPAALKFGDLLASLPGELGKNQFLALNIKCDGQQKSLKGMLSGHPALENIFFFDMSLPDLFVFTQHFPNKNLATRVSDLEPQPLLYDSVAWLWIDCFTRDWNNWELVEKYLNDGKKLAFVSPELHKRDPLPFWESLKEQGLDKKEIWLCADHIEEAKSILG